MRRRLLLCTGIGVAATVASSATARAHEVGDPVLGTGGDTVSFAVVLGLPVVAGLVGGVVAVRYCSHRTSKPTGRRSSVAVGLLVVGIGAATFLSAVIEHGWLAVGGVTVGAVTALSFGTHEPTSAAGCGIHDDLTLGAVSTHRLIEGVVLGTLYTAGAAIGTVGAVVLAGHAAFETAAVGGLYASAHHRIRAAGGIVLVQAGYAVGAVAGLGAGVAVPASARTFVLAVLGGLLLVVGASGTRRSTSLQGRDPGPSAGRESDTG